MMSYHEKDLNVARREMAVRAARWGGVWVTVEHPDHPGEYGVGMPGYVRGEVVDRVYGGDALRLIDTFRLGSRR